MKLLKIEVMRAPKGRMKLLKIEVMRAPKGKTRRMCGAEM